MVEKFIFDEHYELEGEIENMGGMDSYVLIALSRWLKTWPRMQKNPTTDKDVVTLKGEFEFKDNPDNPGEKYGFVKVYSTPGKTGIDGESQGETDGKSVHHKGELHFPGNTVQALALHRKFNNAHGVAIFTDGQNTRLVYGTEGRPCTFSGNVTNGKSPTDPKEAIIFIDCDAYGSMLYDGAIPLIDGEEIPALE